MPTSKFDPGKASNQRKTLLDAVRIQLSSQRPSDVWRGMDQARQWLNANSEDRDVYGLLLDVVQKNRELREQVRNLFLEMTQKGSKHAEEAISLLPSNANDLLADADDAYYAAEYDRAVQLYRQVLKLDPDNSRAKDHIAKAEIKRITWESDGDLPRVAVQYYRRARSYIAARDVVTAMNLLSAAIEAAQGKNMKYPEADEALNNMQNLLTADEYRQKAKLAMGKEGWKEALDLYDKALALDTTNDVMKKELDSLQGLLRAETQLRKRGISKVFASLAQWQNTVESARIVMNPDNPLLNFVEKQLNQIRVIRGVGVIILLIGIVLPLYLSGAFGRFSLAPALANTPTATYTATIRPNTSAIGTGTQTMTPNVVITSTHTLMPTPTLATLGVGYIIKASVSVWDKPNGAFVNRLGLYQIVTLLEIQEASGAIWFRCMWEINGISGEGWILSDYIKFGPPPIPQP